MAADDDRCADGVGNRGRRGGEREKGEGGRANANETAETKGVTSCAEHVGPFAALGGRNSSRLSENRRKS